MVDRPWDMSLRQAVGDEKVLRKDINVIDLFDELGGSFLVLGDPGSGKTTALLELARDLIDRASRDDTLPIPVVFNLSSWAESRKTLEEWLSDELNTKYDVPDYAGQAWIQGDDLLPLLDGLDEVRNEDYRQKCVAAINQFHRQHLVNLIVCSRTADYETLSEKLTLPSAIEQKPLNAEQIDKYLARGGAKLKAVRRAVKNDPILLNLARCPFFLSIIGLAYQGASLAAVGGNTSDEVRDHVFAAYIDRMFTLHPIAKGYTRETIVRRLIWLAQLLEATGQTVFRIEHLQPSAIAGDAKREAYSRFVLAAVWLLAATPIGIAIALSISLVVHSLLGGIIGGLLYALTVGQVTLMAITACYQLKYRIPFGVMFGCALGFTAWVFLHNLLISLPIGVLAGFAAAIGYRRVGPIVYNYSAISEAVLTINPTRKGLGWSWSHAVTGFIDRLPIGLVVGLAGAVVGVLAFGWSFGLSVGVLLGLTMAAAGALSPGMQYVYVASISRPNEGIWRTLDNALRFGLISGVWVAAVTGLLGGLRTNLVGGLEIGFAFFLAGFTVIGLIQGGYTVLEHFVLRVFLSLQGDVPLRYPQFLSQAVRHIFLHQIGGGSYIFIHRSILEYFATKASG